MPPPPDVIALVDDLLFMSKISSVARQLGVPVHQARTCARLVQLLDTTGARRVLVDLNGRGTEPLQALEQLRQRPSPPTTLGFLSHVQTELAEAARRAGCDEVLARSAFVAKLPALLTPGLATGDAGRDPATDEA